MVLLLDVRGEEEAVCLQEQDRAEAQWSDTTDTVEQMLAEDIRNLNMPRGPILGALHKQPLTARGPHDAESDAPVGNAAVHG